MNELHENDRPKKWDENRPKKRDGTLSAKYLIYNQLQTQKKPKRDETVQCYED